MNAMLEVMLMQLKDMGSSGTDEKVHESVEHFHSWMTNALAKIHLDQRFNPCMDLQTKTKDPFRPTYEKVSGLNYARVCNYQSNNQNRTFNF